MSPCTSANFAAASRQTRGCRLLVAGRAGRGEEVVKEGGDRHGLRIEPGAPILGGDDSFPAWFVVAVARERGGSLRLT